MKQQGEELAGVRAGELGLARSPAGSGGLFGGTRWCGEGFADAPEFFGPALVVGLG